jgi:hypothetical protein
MIDRWSYRPEDGGAGKRPATLKRPVTVGALAEVLGVKTYAVIKDLIEFREFARNENHVIKDVTAVVIADRQGVELTIED